MRDERLIKIMFWSEDLRPQDCIRRDIPDETRASAADILSGGRTLARYRGFARCRICQTILGSCDVGNFGFVWPQRAEHYVLKHDIWVPALDDLIAAKVTP